MLFENIKNKWDNLKSRTRKMIKTFFEAGIAYIVTYLTTMVTGLDSESVKILIVSAVATGLSAVLNLNDRG